MRFWASSTTACNTKIQSGIVVAQTQNAAMAANVAQIVPAATHAAKAAASAAAIGRGAVGSRSGKCSQGQRELKAVVRPQSRALLCRQQRHVGDIGVNKQSQLSRSMHEG